MAEAKRGQVVDLEFEPEAWAQLEDLRDRSNSKDRAETIRKALHTLDFLIRKKGQGWKVRLARERDDKVVEVM